MLLSFTAMQETQYKYLDKVDSPDDLKRLRAGELTQYCAELRRFIIAQLSSNPGHLGSSLGVVEPCRFLAFLHSPY